VTRDGGRADPPRWPRRRTSLARRHLDPAHRWDPRRPGEDVPTLTTTVGVTLLGCAVVALLWWASPVVAAVTYGVLLVWSVGVEVTGSALTTRARTPLARAAWVLLRPAYALGIAVWAVVEGLVALLLG
jgi:hypothetical protein